MQPVRHNEMRLVSPRYYDSPYAYVASRVWWCPWRWRLVEVWLYEADEVILTCAEKVAVEGALALLEGE